MPAFLLEIGCEELPAGYVGPALAQLERSFERRLSEEGIPPKGIRTAATPRRLVLFAREVPDGRPASRRAVRGPLSEKAFGPDGRPTPAGAGFAAKNGRDPSAIRFEETPKGRVCVLDLSDPGEPSRAILERALPDLIRGIRFPKSMRWRTPRTTFARPIRRILALLGDRPVPFEIEGVAAGAETAGHPFLAPDAIRVPAADLEGLRDALREACVLLDPEERRAEIERALQERLREAGMARIPRDLLAEVTFLTEWPGLVEGRFDPAFLSVPAIVIEQAMTEHQRYFPVWDGEGRLRDRFLVVANRRPGDPSLIREGNERVLRARLADARFFWETGRKTALEARLPRLAGVLYLQGLGNLRQKADRLSGLAEAFAEEAGLPPAVAAAAARAGLLAKADLVTELVGEFPKLQGLMGREFLVAEGADPAAAEAVGEHYRPRFSGDDIPRTPAGRVVALADKFDHLAACFAAGFAPTGSQDPMGLRRQALGILRILDEGRIPLPLPFAAERAEAALRAQGHEAMRAAPGGPPVAARVLGFLRDRLVQHLGDAGFAPDHVEAVLAPGFDEVPDVRVRLEAIRSLSRRPEWEPLVTLVERTHNIARDAPAPGAVEPARLVPGEESNLYACLLSCEDRIRGYALEGKYEAASLLYHEVLAAPLHRYFEKVFVNVEDAAVRRNRLALLVRLNRLYTERIADLSRIVIPGKKA